MLLVAVMAVTLAACGNGGETPNDGGEAKTVKVGVSIYKFDDNFMTLYRQEIENYFKTKETDEVKYEVTIQDGKNDMAEQTNQIDNFITQGYDVLIINLVQSTSAATIIDKCEAAGKPCIFINREPSEEDMKKYEGMITYVGADARQSGKYQGEIIADLPNKGDINGDGKLQYVMVVGDPENIDAQFRTEYSIKALKDAGVEVECLVEQIGNWATDQGQTITANAITAHGDKIDVVFCNNDGMALGAYAAIEAAGLKVGEDLYLLGVDALPEAIDLMKAGNMTGTVLNDHIAQSHAAVDAAVDVLAGGEMQNYYWANYAKVDKAYVDANY